MGFLKRVKLFPRIVLLGLPLVLLTTMLVDAAPTAGLWSRANHYFSLKQYDSALYYYQQLEQSGKGNAALYYNLGNTYYRLGYIGKAVLYLERALFKEPLNQNIKDNLALAQAQVKLPTTPRKPVFFISWWHSFLLHIAPDWWAILMLLSFLSALWLIYRNIKKEGVTAFTGRWISLLAGLFVFSALLCYFSYHAKHFTNKAVVMENDASFFAHFDDDSHIGQLPLGATVEINKKEAGRYFVNLPNGRKAWMRQDVLEKVQQE